MFPDRYRLPSGLPQQLTAIELETEQLGFQMASVHETGALLRQLAKETPDGHIVELGTGTGIATCWLLDGMDNDSTFESVDIDPEAQSVAISHLGKDARLKLVCEDAEAYLLKQPKCSVDLLFADAWPGKFSHLDQALGLIRVGGVYVGDDLLPQESWPEGHAPKVPAFIEAVNSHSNFETVYWPWSTGILLARRMQ